MKDSVDYKKDCLYHLSVAFAAFKASDLRPDAFLCWFIHDFCHSFMSDESNMQRFYWTVFKLYNEIVSLENKQLKGGVKHG